MISNEELNKAVEDLNDDLDNLLDASKKRVERISILSKAATQMDKGEITPDQYYDILLQQIGRGKIKEILAKRANGYFNGK